jgi:hypothetical protein
MRQACNHPSLASTVDREDTVEDRLPPGAAAAAAEKTIAGGGGGDGFPLDAEDGLHESDDEGGGGAAAASTAGGGGGGVAAGELDGAKLSALMKVRENATFCHAIYI